MKQYLDIVKNILENGEWKDTRTQYRTLAVPNVVFSHDMKNGFPLLTTRKLPWQSLRVELEGFLRGITSKKWYQERNCHYWDEFHNPTIPNLGSSKEDKDLAQYYIDYDDLGPIYGYQWRKFDEVYDENDEGHLQGFDQLQYIVDKLHSNPNDRRMVCSAWNPHHLRIMGLPPCFTHGNVYTNKGYKQISNLSLEDKVLCDDGSFNQINNLYATKYDGKIIKIRPYYTYQNIECTPNHPFLVKDKGYINADKLTCNDYLAIPINKCSKQQDFQFIKYKNQYTTTYSHFYPTKNDFYMMGYFVGDGWVQINSDRICFAIANKDKDKILPKIRQSIKVCKKKNSGINVTTYYTNNKKWGNILRQFGYKAHNKIIPKWVLDYPISYLEEFLKGYIDADGWKKPSGDLQFTTTSESLALNLQQLGLKLGYISKVNKENRPKHTIIENRLVNQRDTYSVFFNTSIKARTFHKWDKENNILWVKIKKIDNEHKKCSVYNIDVDHKHTYTINNFINHNCHMLWGLVHINGVLNLYMTQRSCDIALGVPSNIASYALLLHLLCKEGNFIPGNLTILLADCHMYENHISGIKEQLSRVPTELPRLTIPDNKDGTPFSIFDWTYQDVLLENYFPQPRIRMGEIAV